MKKKVYRERYNILQESVDLVKDIIWNKKLNDKVEEHKEIIKKKPTKKKEGK